MFACVSCREPTSVSSYIWGIDNSPGADDILKEIEAEKERLRQGEPLSTIVLPFLGSYNLLSALRLHLSILLEISRP